MPYIHIQTNTHQPAEQITESLQAISSRLAELLGKPERYVMAQISTDASLLFSGSDDPCAYVELKSIGLPETQTQQLSGEVCQLLEEQLSIAADRVYIEFKDAPRKFWGWNGSTF